MFIRGVFLLQMDNILLILDRIFSLMFLGMNGVSLSLELAALWIRHRFLAFFTDLVDDLDLLSA